MGSIRIMWSGLLLWMAAGMAVCAQSFRRVTNVDDLEPGVRYVLAGYCSDTPDSVFVMNRPDGTGTDSRAGKAHKTKPDGDGRIQLADDGRVAVFELAKDGASYGLRETTLDAWLSYSTLAESSTSASLYLLTGNELANAPITGTKQWHKTFKLQDSGKSFLLTSKEIKFGDRLGQCFLFVNNGMGYQSQFKLYRADSYGDSLFIYKELQPPTVVRAENGDWTFRGDWSAASLYGLDYAQAKRVDFTEISLPQGRGVMGAGGTFPAECVWTYVRKGEAGRLPEGWPNVVEIERKSAEVQGVAVTRIWGGDDCTLGPKYTFEVPAGKGIAWCRDMPTDGGWSTVGLPFAVERVAWDAPEGEAVDVERLAFHGFAPEGAVFRAVEAGEAWEAGTAYLWRPLSPRASRVCFYADETVVRADAQGLSRTEGFHAASGRLEVAGGQGGVYLLSAEGNRFVRAASGSWVAPGRGYLVFSGALSPSLCWKETDSPSGMSVTRERPAAHPFPVYGLDGRCKGWTDEEGGIPEEWPDGIYLTPYGKVLKR